MKENSFEKKNFESEPSPPEKEWPKVLAKFAQFLEEDFSEKEDQFFKKYPFLKKENFLPIDIKKLIFLDSLNSQERDVLKRAIELDLPAAHRFEGVFRFLEDLEKKARKRAGL